MKTILVVDDSLVSRRMVMHALGAVGLGEADFLEASDGHSALQLLKTTPVDLVCSDLYMPVMTGIELVEQARQEGCEAPFILITSERSETVLDRARTAGAAHIVNKPLQADDLRAALDTAGAC